jgi:hypothetical protein
VSRGPYQARRRAAPHANGPPEMGAPPVKSDKHPQPPDEGLETLLADLGFAAILTGFAVQRTLARTVAALGAWLFRVGETAVRAVGVSPSLRPPSWLQTTADQGRSELRSARSTAAEVAHRTTESLFVEFLDGVDVDTVLDRLDLDELTKKMLDRIDVSAITDTMLQKVDLVAVTDAILDEVDLVPIARRVIDGLELGELIRESTGTVTVEAVDAIRVGGMNADRALARLIDRLLRRQAERSLSPDGGHAVP